MLDHHPLPPSAHKPLDLALEEVENSATGVPGPQALEKLYHVPRAALQDLLESREPGLKVGSMSQAELVSSVGRLSTITADDVENLFNDYRYGQELAFYLYLLPDGLASPSLQQIQQALIEPGFSARPGPDPHRASEPAEASEPQLAVSGPGYEAQGPPTDLVLTSEGTFDGIREIDFRYHVAHRFINAREEPDLVLESRFGFLWLDLDLGYLAILTRDEEVNGLLIRALAQCLQAMPVRVRFAKELVDKHFSIEKIKRVSHYDPGTGVRQSLSGDGLWRTFDQEIMAREKRYARPSSLYEEEVAAGVTSGLGVAANKGKIYLTKALPASMLRVWGMQRLPELVRDAKDLRASRPGTYSRSIEAINRIRLTVAGKAAVARVVEALLQSDREDLRRVELPQAARGIYESLKGKYFNPYLRTQCARCEESASLCPHCESVNLDLKDTAIKCRDCGARISERGSAHAESVTLRCMNGHVNTVLLEEAWSIAPNHWFQKRMTSIFEELGQSWSETDDYFHIEGATLYRLRRGQIDNLSEREALPQVVQTYINNFWEPVRGQVHTGSGNLMVDTSATSDQGSRAIAQLSAGEGPKPWTYRSFDLRLRGDIATGYTVEAGVQDGGSVPPQPLVFPPSAAFQRLLQSIARQTTTEEGMRRVGEILFNALFPTRILKLWSRSLGNLEDGEGLRLRLSVGPLELMTLPWELLHEEEYVGLRLRFPVVRYLELPDPPRPLTVEPPLRVLVAIAQPLDVRPFDAASELAGIRAALAQWPDMVEVDLLQGARREELLAKLRTGYHVLHYIGHASLRRAAFEGEHGYLLLEDEERRADPVPALLLGQMVADSQLRLAVLNACETASNGFDGALGGVAQQFVEGGIPAVVAMQQTVADQTSAAFSHAFYGALANGWPVDAAVQEGRRGIMTSLGSRWTSLVDWAIPTLYMRTTEAHLLEIEGTGSS